MAPAFPTTRRAAAFGAMLAVLLLLPVILHAIGGVSLGDAYRGISERAGNFPYLRQEIFDEHGDTDILLTGSSLLGNAVDASYVQRELSRALGRPASVVMLRQSWQGPDLNYFVARDFMERRKVKLVVISTPAWVQRSSQPHVQLLRVIRYGDHPGALDGLSLRGRLAVYADYVLGAPRQALNLLRPNVPDSHVDFPSSFTHLIGYFGRPFVPHEVVIPPVPAESMIFSGANRDVFHFDGPPLNGYQLHFLRKMGELADQHGAHLVLLHLPSPSERGSQIVPERQPVLELLKPGVSFVGVPSARMFANVPDDQFEDYYQDEHLGLNGSKLFSGVITPALIHLYEQYTQAR